MDIIRELEKEQLKSDITPFNVGDTIRVYAKVVEGSRERLQMFEGVVIKRQNGGIRETFTVRRIASGVGVERTWPLHSPRVDRIEVVRRGIVRRAKLFYLRDRVGKASKTKEKLGARIENKEVVLKEEMVEESVSEEVLEETPVLETNEAVVEEIVETAEEVKEEPSAEESKE